MSGKTVLIKTLLFHIHNKLKLSTKEEIYILDFGNGLKEYSVLPFVVGYFNASHEESVRRVFKILTDKLTENTKKLSGYIYSEVEETNRPSHVTFILDGFSGFITEERYLIYQDMLRKLARDGLSKGVTVIISGSDTSGFNRISSSFNRIIALDLPKDNYSELYSSKTEKPVALKGRGMANLDQNVYEFQAYLPWDFSVYKTDDEKKMIKQIKWRTIFYGLTCDSDDFFVAARDEKEILDSLLNLISNKNKKNKEIYELLLSRKIKTLPEEYLTSENWCEYSEFSLTNNDGDFVAGLDYYSLEPVPSVNPAILNLKNAQTIAIYGKKEFGKSNLLKLLIEAAARIPNTHFCFWEDGRHALSKPTGLNQLINQLKYAETVYSGEDAVAYLQRNEFLTENIDNPSEDFTYGLSIDDENSKRMYEEEFEQWLDEYAKQFRLERDSIVEHGDSTDVNKLKEKYEAIIENKKKELNEKYRINKTVNSVVPLVVTSENCKVKPHNYLTVFVIQSRLFYQTYFERGRENLISKIDYILGKSLSPILFIFSDVQRIENRDFQIQFNNSVRYAFLLDDIVRFINNKGQNSVFGNQDISELKESFGYCELGDGFFYDIDRDCISKLKFIHSFPDKR